MFPKLTKYKSEETKRLEQIRTLGLYQPYATLMLHGKIESRWIRKGKKPPFPLGKYMIYSTKRCYVAIEFEKMCPEDLRIKAKKLFDNDSTSQLETHHYNGYAIGIGNLVEVCPMPAMWFDDAFYWPDHTQIEYSNEEMVEINGYVLWALRFEKVKRIKPFPFKGKQGVGFLSKEDEAKIEYL